MLSAVSVGSPVATRSYACPGSAVPGSAQHVAVAAPVPDGAFFGAACATAPIIKSEPSINASATRFIAETPPRSGPRVRTRSGVGIGLRSPTLERTPSLFSLVRRGGLEVSSGAADTADMTASRVCRACGADLAGNVRWCLRCHEPVRELTPREPVWRDGEFVDQPVHTGGAVPHWSRWEKSATTFGPAGRLTITVVAVLWLLSAAIRSPLTLLFVLPLMIALIRSVWQRGWVVPSHAAAPARMTPVGPMSTWLWDRSEFWRTCGLAGIWLAGAGVLISVD